MEAVGLMSEDDIRVTPEGQLTPACKITVSWVEMLGSVWASEPPSMGFGESGSGPPFACFRQMW